MGSALAALLDHGRRRRLRSRETLFLALGGLGAVAAAVLLPGGPAGGRGSPPLEAALAVVGVLAGLVAVGSAGSLPSDRASGALAWLRAGAAPAPALRGAPAVVGAALAVGAALLGALVAGGLLAVGHGLPAVDRTRPVEVRGPARLVAPGGSRSEEPTILATGEPFAGARLLEVEIRPLFRDLEAATIGTLALRVGTSAGEREVQAAVRGPTRIPLDAGGDVRLENLEPRIDVVLVAARLVKGPSSALANLLLAGLALGVAMACGAPLAVLLSRALSAPTAAATGALLLLVGVTREPLLTLAADAGAVEGGAPAAAVLRAAAAVAPDLSAVGATFEVAAGRAVPASALTGLWPAVAYAVACLLAAAFLPSRDPAA